MSCLVGNKQSEEIPGRGLKKKKSEELDYSVHSNCGMCEDVGIGLVRFTFTYK